MSDLSVRIWMCLYVGGTTQKRDGVNPSPTVRSKGLPLAIWLKQVLEMILSFG